jgi:asparagine synthetase B (glutamine-hydrolysing)
MPRFVVIVDWGQARSLESDLVRAREAMTLGGSSEYALELQRPGFGAVVLSHESEVPVLLSGGSLILSGGHGLPDEDDASFLLAMADWVRTGDGRAPQPRPGPRGRRCLVRWDPATREVLLVAESNGLAPLFFREERERIVLATEPKGIWAVAGADLHLDADSVVDLFTIGECTGERSLSREITAFRPGTVRCLSPGRSFQGTWYDLRFSAHVGGRVESAAEAMNAALLAILSAERARNPRVTITLSGGMDSRYLLAGARRVWSEVKTFTFGPPESRDVLHAREVARRAGVPNEYAPWSDADLASWAPFGVWRADGMQNCLHHHGMDALITRSSGLGLVLNGMGGDILTGAFLRPTYLLLPGDPARAVDTILARYHLHDRAPHEIFKPELLRERRSTTRASLLEVVSRQPYERLGNALLGYWVRQHCPRLTVLGIELEAPFLEYSTPLADPYFVDAVSAFSLEQRFLGRAYRRALGRLDRRLLDVTCDRYGIAPRWPWPVLALGGMARRLRLVRRARLRGAYTEGFRGPVRPWVRDLLLDRETSADGFFLPAYVSSLVADHAAGRADHAAELGMALALELWRRMFMAGRRELARPPVPLPQLRPPLRSLSEASPLQGLRDSSGESTIRP